MWDKLAPGALVQPCPGEREEPLSPDRRRRRRRLECEPLRRLRLCLDLLLLLRLRLLLRLALLASFGGGIAVAFLSGPLAVVSGKEEDSDSELACIGGAALLPASMTMGVAACAVPSPEEEEEESSAGSCALGAG